MHTGFKRVVFGGTSDECNIINSFTPQEATEIPKIYLATFLLASVQYFFHGNKASTKLQTLKHPVLN